MLSSRGARSLWNVPTPDIERGASSAGEGEMKWLLLLLPWLELWTLIELGVQSSAAVALLWVLVSAVAGLSMLRFAGRHSLAHLKDAQQLGILSEQLLLDDFAQMLAGILLLIPGLLSDALAIVVWVRPLRRLFRRALLGRVTGVMGAAYGAEHEKRGAGAGEEGVTLEGEYHQVGGQSLERDPPDSPTQPQ